ncbi:MAG: aldo/keto reductase [Candidatus Zixiibacteriota bacterium]|jgi:aryl-alcohol dehydrogenase-like predicted oxidoreductase
MDFTKRTILGRTGLTVSRMGLASGYGVPDAAIERAFHEYGVNYFYLSFLKRDYMARAIRRLAPAHRDDLRVVLAWPFFVGFSLKSFVNRWLKKLKIERADLLLIQGLRQAPGGRLLGRLRDLKESGKVRFVGMSSHDRNLFGRIARGEVEAAVDFFQIRYSAVNTGAETDVFPHLPGENRPGVVIFTATCWGKLLNPGLMPPGERPPAPADCYRFVLSHPDVDVCITGPSTAEQMEANLRALAAGPLDEEEMARIRRIGRHIYGKS